MEEKIDFLLVEDSSNDAHFIERIILKEKLTEKHIWLSDGEQVIEYFEKEENPKPRFILLDIKMPKMNGFEVLKKLKAKEETKHIPIIIYSSSVQESDVDKAYALGANSYISKPHNYNEMKSLFILLFQYWIRYNKIIAHG